MEISGKYERGINMNINYKKDGTTLLVSLGGDIDHHTAQEISDGIARSFRHSHCKNIVIDFGGVNFMDSSGIGMLIGRYKETEIFGGSLAAVSVSGELMKIFRLSGLNKIINCYDNARLALSAMKNDN